MGSQWKGDPDGNPEGQLQAKVPGQEGATPAPSTPETEPLKKAEPQASPATKVPGSKDEQQPSENTSQGAVKTTAEKTSPAQNNKSAPAVTQPTEQAETTASTEKPSAPPIDVEEKPKDDKKKDALALIVTPEDLGENQITYSVQAGTFLDKDLAQIRLEQLQAKKYPVFLVSAWDNKKQLWYTVRVGRFTDIMQAQMAAKEITRKERIPASVYGVGSLRYEEPLEPEMASPAATPPTATEAAPKDGPSIIMEPGL